MNCGLHVHFGNGFDWIPLDHLRRMAAFLYAADSVIVHLHPNRRKTYYYCRGPSIFSRLAHGISLARLDREVGECPVEVVPPRRGPEPEPLPEPIPREEHRSVSEEVVCCGCVFYREPRSPEEPEMERPQAPRTERPQVPRTERPQAPRTERPEASRTERPEAQGRAVTLREEEEAPAASNYQNYGPRGLLGGYRFDEDFKQAFLDTDVDGWRIHPMQRPPPRVSPGMPIRLAIRRLLEADRVEAVQVYMAPGMGERFAYNFQHYGPIRHEYPDDKRTVEFRQGAGSFDGEAIEAWCKICVRLAEWPAEASDDDFMNVIHDCINAAGKDDDDDGEENVQWYDVFDLLNDLGLGNEAQIMHRRALLENSREPPEELADERVIWRSEASSGSSGSGGEGSGGSGSGSSSNGSEGDNGSGVSMPDSSDAASSAESAEIKTASAVPVSAARVNMVNTGK